MTEIVQWSSSLLEWTGVAVIMFFAGAALARTVLCFVRGVVHEATFNEARRVVARGILLGLEFLVAGDIIQTVAVDLNLTSVSVLGLVVLIRTFLSFTVEVEVTGRWPWQHKRSLEKPRGTDRDPQAPSP